MMGFGWKSKAEKLRMTILSLAHQPAKPLPPGLVSVLDTFRRAAKGVVTEQELVTSPALPDVERPLFEPTSIYGWNIEATLYLKNNELNPGHVELWWLVHAIRTNDNESPSDKQIAQLDKILAHLGADPVRDAIITPHIEEPTIRSGPLHQARIPFGWWTWRNTQPLFEIHVNKDKTRPKEMIKIVPLGTAATDGYESIPGESREGKP